jgi:hypothetical protein
MIVKKYWTHYDKWRHKYAYKGIFLLGFIPIYIERSDCLN